MRITEKRFPIVAAILVALFFCTIPEAANAAPPPFDAANCMTQMQNATTRRAQDMGANSSKIYNAGELISSKTAFCWNSIIMPIWNLIGLYTTAGGVGGIFNAIGAIMWQLLITVLTSIVNSIFNAICGAALGIVGSAISFLKSLICLPLPHFNINFTVPGSYAGGFCKNGISLVNLLGALPGTRQTLPAAWGVMGINRQLH